MWLPSRSAYSWAIQYTVSVISTATVSAAAGSSPPAVAMMDAVTIVP